MAILVTGGTGFLGRHVVEMLRSRDEEVRVLARTPPPRPRGGPAPAAAERVRFVTGDVLDPASVRDAAKGCRAVIHLAGRVVFGSSAEDDLFPLHVEGTRNVLAAAREAGAARVVHVSTSGTVGISRDLDAVANEESPYAIELARPWPYYLSKIYAEKVALEEHARHGTPVVVLNPALLLGPGPAAANEVVARFLRREVAAVPAGVVSIVDVRDAAAMAVAALERGAPGRRFLLGRNLGFDELFSLLEQVSGVAGPRTRIPTGARGAAERAAKVLEGVERALGWSGEEAASLAMAGFSWAVSSDRARAELGFAPRPLEETLAAAVEAVDRGAPVEPAGLLSQALGSVHRITGRLARRDRERRRGE